MVDKLARDAAARHYETHNTREETIEHLAALLEDFAAERMQAAVLLTLAAAAEHDDGAGTDNIEASRLHLVQAEAFRQHASRLQQLAPKRVATDRWKEPWSLWDLKKCAWCRVDPLEAPMTREFAMDLAAIYNRHSGHDATRFEARPVAVCKECGGNGGNHKEPCRRTMGTSKAC